MVNDENVGADLAAAERERRSALWALSALQPGDPAAMTLLQKLEPYACGPADVDRSCKHLLSMVVTSTHRSGRAIVAEHSIPMPWRERFDQASVGSTRLAAGPYLDDLKKFVDEWEREMIHLQAHRDAVRSS